MGENYSPSKGDRVRVVLEGEVVQRPSYVEDFAICDELGGPHTWVQPQFKHVVSVKKIEPPVEVFKPGDVVRRKRDGQLILILEGNRFTDLTGKVAGWIGHGAPRGFRSDYYELFEAAILRQEENASE